MTRVDLPPSVNAWGEFALGLFALAAKSARAARQTARSRPRPSPRRRRGATLRPGPATPLWNELVRAAQPCLVRRGDKARLARLLGLPRQRLQDCLRAGTACLDAERTLLLLCWVHARQQGRELVA